MIGSEVLLFRGGSGSRVHQIFNLLGLIDFLIRLTNIKYLLLKEDSQKKILLKPVTSVNYGIYYVTSRSSRRTLYLM